MNLENGVNVNAANSSSFSVIIGNPWSELIPYVRTATTSILSIGVNDIVTGNPNRIHYPKNIVDTSDFYLEFMIDENLKSLKLLWTWFESIKDTNIALAAGNTADIYIPIYDSSQCHEVACFKYRDAFPKSIPSMVWNYNDNSSNPMVISVNFAASYPDMVFMNKEDFKYKRE